MNDQAALKVLNLKVRWMPSPEGVTCQWEWGGRSSSCSVLVMLCSFEPGEMLALGVMDDAILLAPNV